MLRHVWNLVQTGPCKYMYQMYNPETMAFLYITTLVTVEH